MKKLKLFLALLCTVFLCQTTNAEEVTVDEIKYSIDASAKTASVIANSYSGDIVIPVSFTYEGVDYSVTSIGSFAFDNCMYLTGIEIPSSVTSIGDYAFYGCSGLTSVEIPSSVTSIGVNAFQCSGLTGIEIPSSVTSIRNDAFLYCSNLESISVSKENTVYDSRDNSNAITSVPKNSLTLGSTN